MRLALLAAVLALLVPDRARACGGGLVSNSPATVGADVQRIFLAPSDASTTVVTQVKVPATSASYGVLIPLPARPELDPRPVASEAFDELELETLPHIVQAEPSDGLLPGCGGAATKGARLGGVVNASPPVVIGPVTAVTLTADGGTAVNEWLAANGFALPADGRALVDAYAGTGRFFLAIKRSNGVGDSAPSSVGVRFTLPGDQRVVPFRFARLGAAPTVAFTVFVAARVVVGPAPPFEGLTVNQLDARLVGQEGYARTLAAKVAERHGRAFVIESVRTRGALPPDNALLAGLGADTVITRLSTIVKRDDLTADANLGGPGPAKVPDTITVPALASVGPGILFLGVAVLARTRRRPPRRSGILDRCRARGA